MTKPFSQTADTARAGSSSAPAILRGSIVALVTPMLEDGQIDFAGLRRLIDWHINEGTAGICVVGTTGESPSVSFEEHYEIIHASVQHAAGRIPVMAGCGANATAEAVSLAKFAAEAGADSQLQVVPYYNRPGQEGLYQHFRTIAEAAPGLPMVLYNVPGRTAADLQHETVLRLAQVPGIVGIKEATADMERAQWLIRDLPEHFAVYSGDDPTAIALMLCGGHGSISVTANIAPGLVAQLCKAAIAGDTHQANALQQRLLPLHRALFCEANPIPLKWAMHRLELCGPTLRLPLTLLGVPGQTAMEQALQETGLID